MKPVKRWNRYEIVYRIKGYKKLFSERFDTEEEANIRIAEISLLKKKGMLRPPTRVQTNRYITVSEFLDEYVARHGANQWGDSYYSVSLHRINDYVKPFIGDLHLRDVTTLDIDDYYDKLSQAPAVRLPGHKDQEKKVSVSVIEKVHSLLRSAFSKAIKWGYIVTNPVTDATVPSAPTKRRQVWTPADAKRAMDACRDRNLKACIMLAIGCSMRIGEILGLQWDDVHLSEKGTPYLVVKQELKRCSKKTLEVLEEKNRSSVFFTFPEMKPDCKTSLVLKTPKTESSVRTIYIPETVAGYLRDLQEHRAWEKDRLHGLYEDFNLVIAQDNGRPVEERLIAKAFKAFIEEQDLPMVVFHSLRHLSTSMKLQVSGGDIKAVQGDTGHAQASMVTEVYAHTFDENRKRIADQLEVNFFGANPKEAPKTEDPDREALLRLLESDPELSSLLLAMAKKCRNDPTETTFSQRVPKKKLEVC